MASGTAEDPDAEWICDLEDSDHVRFVKSVDWSASALGPLAQWPVALRLHTYQLLSDSRPAIIYWGIHKIAIYNEAFVPLAGKAHPKLMGIGFQQGFPEIWENMKPIFDLAESSRKAVDVVQIPLTVERNGFEEETYFTGNFNPLRQANGAFGGFYNALFESTDEKLKTRRTAMLNQIATPWYTHTMSTIGSHLVESLTTNEFDIPMAMLYLNDNDSEPPNCKMTLCGSIGVPNDHRLHIHQASWYSQKGVFPLFRKAQSERMTIAPGPEFKGLRWKGHMEPCTSITVLPLAHAGRSFGHLLIGANPRRPIDQVYDQFMQDLSRQIVSTIASMMSQQQAVARQERLEQGLAESERQIRYMAQHASVAMANISIAGEIIWANDIYFELIAGASQTPDHRLPFLSAVLPEDQTILQTAWNTVMEPGSVLNIELRMKRAFSPPTGDPVAATVLLSAFPYRQDGTVKSVMSCMTDVSRLKWAEAWQAREAQEALEANARQIELTDTISHEIRNPLSAIFQLADSIVTSSGNFSNLAPTAAEYHQLITDHVEAARIILVCASHQKSIVDDVLNLSKMDVMLTVLSPTPTRLYDVVDEAVKILHANFTTHDIQLQCNQDASMEVLGIDQVMCDSLRLKQVLINLLSNAIKFTKDKDTRRISIVYGATLSDPRGSFPEEVRWAGSEQPPDDPTTSETWGTGQTLHLTFSISDTGIGMDQETIKRMFQRFEQASPRTTIQYGGSGLGLFISEKLCRKQGGRICVASELGRGSTLGFYIKVREVRTKTVIAVDTPRLDQGPLNNGPRPELLRDLNALNLTKKNISPAASHARRPMHVLLVEDNLVNQKILRKQLIRNGCIVDIANHGVEALDSLRKSLYWTENKGQGTEIDIILMDCEMPIMDGLTCTREIRHLESLKLLSQHVQIIAVTANARGEQIDRALHAGVDEVITKPFVVADLIRVIEARVRR